MNLSDQQMQDFIDAWRKDFGETLLPEAAGKEIERLVAFGRKLAAGEARQRAAIVESEQTEIFPLTEHDNLKAVWRQAMRNRLNKRT